MEPLSAPSGELQAIYAAMACGVAVYDAADTIIYANDAAQRILGLTGDQIEGRTSLDPRWQAVHEDGSGLPGAEHPARVALRTGQAQRAVTIGVTHPNGERQWLQVDAVPTLGAAGEVLRVVTSFADITARKQLEETLRASEARFRAMADFNGDLILVVDALGITRYASRSHRRLLGVEPEEVEGRSIFESIHPDDQPRARVALDLSVRAADSIAHGELRLRHADGSWRTFEIIRNNLLDDPTVQGLLIDARDITERKRAEAAAAHLAAIVESSDDAIISMTLEGQIETWNAGATRLYGFSPEEAIGQHSNMLAPVDRFPEIARLLDQLGQGARIVQFDTVLIRKDGTSVDVSLSISPIRDSGGRIIGASTIARDITAQVQAHRELEQARAQAEELARLRSDFVASVSHELRTPLASILGYAELLQGWRADLQEPKRLAYLDRIVMAARRQKQLVEDLLLVTRLEGEGVIAQREAVGLSTLVRRAAQEVQGSYHDQQMLLEGPADLAVTADAGHVAAILANLLDNAAKYSPEGGSIQISWQREGDRAVVRVRDKGAGIAEQSRAVLFTRFGRVPGSPIRAGRVGTGLGLFLARRLAELMGGRLDLEATGPGGSTFRLELPAAPG